MNRIEMAKMSNLMDYFWVIEKIVKFEKEYYSYKEIASILGITPTPIKGFRSNYKEIFDPLCIVTGEPGKQTALLNKEGVFRAAILASTKSEIGLTCFNVINKLINGNEETEQLQFGYIPLEPIDEIKVDDINLDEYQDAYEETSASNDSNKKSMGDVSMNKDKDKKEIKVRQLVLDASNPNDQEVMQQIREAFERGGEQEVTKVLYEKSKDITDEIDENHLKELVDGKTKTILDKLKNNDIEGDKSLQELKEIENKLRESLETLDLEDLKKAYLGHKMFIEPMLRSEQQDELADYFGELFENRIAELEGSKETVINSISDLKENEEKEEKIEDSLKEDSNSEEKEVNCIEMKDLINKEKQKQVSAEEFHDFLTSMFGKNSNHNKELSKEEIYKQIEKSKLAISLMERCNMLGIDANRSSVIIAKYLEDSVVDIDRSISKLTLDAVKTRVEKSANKIGFLVETIARDYFNGDLKAFVKALEKDIVLETGIMMNDDFLENSPTVNDIIEIFIEEDEAESFIRVLKDFIEKSVG